MTIRNDVGPITITLTSKGVGKGNDVWAAADSAKEKMNWIQAEVKVVCHAGSSSAETAIDMAVSDMRGILGGKD